VYGRHATCFIRIVTFEDVNAGDCYATYQMGLLWGAKNNVHQPADFRQVGLHRTAARILSVSESEAPPKIHLSDYSRPIPDKYVCIATKASTRCKRWNKPKGWREVISFLKEKGYRVICIDKDAEQGIGLVWNHIPNGAEDQTGDIALLSALAQTCGLLCRTKQW